MTLDKKEIWSIPNIMGYFRILLIPVYLYVYYHAEGSTGYMAAAAVVAVSGLTDMLDGKIARRFHMVTNLGKVLDPGSGQADAVCGLHQFDEPFSADGLAGGIVVHKRYLSGGFRLVSSEKGNGEYRCEVVRKGVHGGIFRFDGRSAFVYGYFLFCCGAPHQCASS